MMLAFVIVHVYPTTTRPTSLAHPRAMVTGRDEVDEPGLR
jgi:hypothetical protein